MNLNTQQKLIPVTDATDCFLPGFESVLHPAKVESLKPLFHYLFTFQLKYAY